MNKQQLEELLEGLKTIRIAGPTDPFFGLCSNLRVQMRWRRGFDLDEWMAEAWQDWPQFSGHDNYPVPHPRMNCETAYNHTELMWSRKSQYGLARWDLLDWLIKKAEEQLNGIQQART